MEKRRRFTLHLDKVLRTYIEAWETSDVSLIDVAIFIEESLLQAYYIMKQKSAVVTDEYEVVLKMSLPESKRRDILKKVYNKTIVFAGCLQRRLDNTFFNTLKEEELKQLSVVVYDKETGILIVEYPHYV